MLGLETQTQALLRGTAMTFKLVEEHLILGLEWILI